MKHRVILAAMAAFLILPAASQAAQPRADLEIAPESSLPATARAGATFKAVVSVRNRSGTRAGKSRSVLVLSKNGMRDKSDTTLAGFRSRPIRPASSRKFKLSPQVPATVNTGDYKVIACADDTDLVREFNEGNNCRVLVKFFKVSRDGTTPDPPGPPDPPDPPAPPMPGLTGLKLSPSPLTLGPLSTTSTQQEYEDAGRYLTLTNYGPGPSAPVATSEEVPVGGPYTVLGQANGTTPACIGGQVMAEGDSCAFFVLWLPDGTGPFSANFRIYDPITVKVVTSVQFRAGLISRPYFTGSFESIYAGPGDDAKQWLYVENIGDVTGSFSYDFDSQNEDVLGDFSYDFDPMLTDTCAGDSTLTPGEECRIPIKFCSATPGQKRNSVQFLAEPNNTPNDVVVLKANVIEVADPGVCGDGS